MTYYYHRYYCHRYYCHRYCCVCILVLSCFCQRFLSCQESLRRRSFSWSSVGHLFCCCFIFFLISCFASSRVSPWHILLLWRVLRLNTTSRSHLILQLSYASSSLSCVVVSAGKLKLFLNQASITEVEYWVWKKSAKMTSHVPFTHLLYHSICCSSSSHVSLVLLVDFDDYSSNVCFQFDSIQSSHSSWCEEQRFLDTTYTT